MRDAPKFQTIEEFRAAVKDHKIEDAGPLNPLRHSFESTVRVVPDMERTLEFTISTDAIDRAGDKISQDGWQLENYRKNPVVMWAHAYDLLPVARCVQVGPEAGKLRALAEFTPAGMAKFNDTVFDMYRLGFLSATSVGFMPIRWEWVDEEGRRYGIDFIEQELLEFSTVPVPCNPEALIGARSAGIDTAPLRAWAEKLLDSEDLVAVSKGALETLRRAAGAPEVLSVRFRKLADSLPKSAKGARGQLAKCSKMAREISRNSAADWGYTVLPPILVGPDGSIEVPEETRAALDRIAASSPPAEPQGNGEAAPSGAITGAEHGERRGSYSDPMEPCEDCPEHDSCIAAGECSNSKAAARKTEAEARRREIESFRIFAGVTT